ncbi:MAG TPA: DNA repair protein RadA [Thermoanaerobaculia bacterium]|nr:DNA repair protein RadA [Thermoanaerobaculia bacterium]
MAKKALVFACTDCGSQSSKWLGRCPDCNAWNSFVEEVPSGAGSPQSLSSSSAPISLASVDFDDCTRISTRLETLDRVLGGGLVPGAVTLIAGEPGIGKSTLLLQVARQLAFLGTVLYVSGEESPKQIALRAKRLDTVDPNIALYSETSIEKIVAAIEKMRPVAVIIDSIQTVHTTVNQSSAGSIGQVRDSAGTLMAVAKKLAIPIFLIGHITKEGTIAGPKALEHIVDTVLYFEGDRFQNYRLVRATKNRFGPVGEVAIYQMHDTGLEEVPNPSAALIAQRSSSAGSAVVVAIEGTRPILVEVQALVSVSHFASPRRMAMGVDSNRLALLLAVLEKRSGENFLSQDVYVNIAGGLSLDEPAVDLGIIAALVSSQRNVPIAHDVAVFGEVGLLGEVRSISQSDLRAKEASTLGFTRVILPQANAEEVRSAKAIGVSRVEDFIGVLFAK